MRSGNNAVAGDMTGSITSSFVAQVNADRLAPILGGNFFFISHAPSAMKRLALLTPNGWALRGFTDQATVEGGFGTIAEPVLGIIAFSAIVAATAVVLAPRAVTA